MSEPVSIIPDWPAPDHVKIISTTREGGFSLAPYDSFNLALHTNDDKTHVEKNRAKLRQHFHLPSEPVWLNQIHSSVVVSLDDDLINTSMIINADASSTKQTNRVCAVLTADCLPVFITDVKGSVVAIAHAGWKGLLAGVISETVKSLGVDNQDLLVWFGPAIGSESFVVGNDVKALFGDKGSEYLQAFRESGDAGFWHCDLYRLARIELTHLGIKKVYGGDLCTYRDDGRFFSYRRDGENTGRQAHCIWLTA